MRNNSLQDTEQQAKKDSDCPERPPPPRVLPWEKFCPMQQGEKSQADSFRRGDRAEVQDSKAASMHRGLD